MKTVATVTGAPSSAGARARGSQASTPLAITGATGFVGQTVVDQLSSSAIPTRALVRRMPDQREGVVWVAGALDNSAALDRLMESAKAVLHIAGAVNVPTRAAFAAANITGTRNVITAAKRAGIKRFIHVSSLVAREPSLSNYGWSKAEAEQLVIASGLDWTIVRPPAVYGPRDRDMFGLFAMARRGFMLLPPAGRTSLIHVDDLARLLNRLVTTETTDSHGQIYEPDDGTDAGGTGGLSHRQLAQAIGVAMGRKHIFGLSASRPLLHLAARADRMIRGDHARLTPDRAGYMAHPDWVCDPALAVPAELWSPAIPHIQGLSDTAQWYHGSGWFD